MPLTEKIANIREDVANAALRAGRDPSGVTLLAVTKTRSVDEIRDAVAAGIGHIGENRIQEAAAKLPQVSENVVKHMIGHVQSNKGSVAADLFDWVDSVDSKKIADILSRRATETGKTLNVLMQVNISDEAAKSGIDPGSVRDLAIYVAGSDGLAVRGLLTISSFGGSAVVRRDEFARMKELFDSLREEPGWGAKFDVLSMGMSGDFEIAVEEGSTMVRIGTALFGERT